MGERGPDESEVGETGEVGEVMDDAIERVEGTRILAGSGVVREEGNGCL